MSTFTQETGKQKIVSEMVTSIDIEDFCENSNLTSVHIPQI